MAVSVSSLAQAAAARVATAEPQLFRAGQVLEALVLGKAAGGLTELQIGDLLVVARLPENLTEGALLQLLVKTGGATPQLALLSQGASANGTGVSPPVLAQGAANLGVQTQIVQLLQEAPAHLSRSTLAPERGAAVPAAAAAPAKAAVLPTAQGRPVLPMPDAGAAEAAPQSSPHAAVAATTGRQVQATRPIIAATPAPSGPAAEEVPRAPMQSGSPSAPAPAAEETAQPPAGLVSMTPKVAPTLPMPMTPAAASSVTPGATPNVVETPAAQVAPLDVATAGVSIVSEPQQAATTAAAAMQVTATGVEAKVPMPAAQIVSSPSLQAIARDMVVSQPMTPEPQASNPLLVAQAASRPQASVADLPRAVVAPPAAPPATPLPLPATPKAALAQMVPEAMARQNSLGPLLTSLAALVTKPMAMPEPVLRAALQLLAQRVVVTGGEVTARQIDQAVARSGVFLEAGLAKAAPQPGDVKAGLLSLRGALADWLGSAAPANAGSREPPPIRGMPPRADNTAPAVLPEESRDLAKLVHGQADAAVSRTKLMQLASLPDAGPARATAHELRLELPFLIGHELVMAQIQIARDGARHEIQRKRGWTMRFAMHFASTGEVGAEIGILDKSVNVALWAVEPETAMALGEMLPELSGALEAMGLKPGAIRCRNGAPAPAKLPSGQLLDEMK